MEPPWSRALSNSAVDCRVLWNQLPELVKDYRPRALSFTRVSLTRALKASSCMRQRAAPSRLSETAVGSEKGAETRPSRFRWLPQVLVFARIGGTGAFSPVREQRPVQPQNRVLVCAARTLNAADSE